jgi:Ni,Fe-hydrogenase III small subunit/formate hydrogenlyase subunit 6/NADH:ubiquinone oxidoreductase subunit I
MSAIKEIFRFLTKKQNMDLMAWKGINPSARGIPAPIKSTENCKTCKECVEVCPTDTISIKDDSKLRFDYSSCLQCGLCTASCPEGILENTGIIGVFSSSRERLQVTFSTDAKPETAKPITVSAEVLKYRKVSYGQGLNYREVAAAGNNSVECELGASFNAVFDSESHGIRCVASPKHADVVLFSGPVSKNMSGPLEKAWDTMPSPKLLVACGTEASSGGCYAQGKTPKEPDFFIAGDPPRPDTILSGLLFLLGRTKLDFQDFLQSWYKNKT